MLNLDPAKLLVILVVALIVLGPDRLPRVARQLAVLWREFARVRDQVSTQVRDAMPDVDLTRIPSPSGAIASFLRPSPQQAPPRSEQGPGPARGAPARTAPGVVVHGGLEDVAFLPDDPSMN